MSYKVVSVFDFFSYFSPLSSCFFHTRTPAPPHTSSFPRAYRQHLRGISNSRCAALLYTVVYTHVVYRVSRRYIDGGVYYAQYRCAQRDRGGNKNPANRSRASTRARVMRCVDVRTAAAESYGTAATNLTRVKRCEMRAIRTVSPVVPNAGAVNDERIRGLSPAGRYCEKK